MNYLNSANFPATASAALSGFVHMFAPARSWVPTSWNAAAYTGNGIVNNGTNHLGYNDRNRGYGSTTIQAAPGKIGLFLNGFSTENHKNPYVNQWSMGVSNKSYAGNHRPWAKGNWLHCAANITINGQFMAQGACGYSYLVLVVLDTTTNKAVHLLWALSDSRTNANHPAYADVSIEAGGIPVAFATAGVTNANTAYCQNLGAEQRLGPGNSTDNFWFLIGPRHMQNLLSLIRARGPEFANLSTNASDYQLLALSLQPELAATSGQPANIPGQFGWTVNSCNFVSK